MTLSVEKSRERAATAFEQRPPQTPFRAAFRHGQLGVIKFSVQADQPAKYMKGPDKPC